MTARGGLPGGVAGSASSVEPRVAPGTRRDVGAVAWAFATLAGRVAGTAPPNLFLTLGRHRRMFWGWLGFAGTLMPGGRLSRRESELVILRVAHLQGSAYEFDHHVRLGKRAGVTPADLRRLTVDPAVDPAAGHAATGGWTPREAAMLDASDALIDREDLDDDEWRRVATQLDQRELIELVMLVGHYRMLATTIGVLRIQPDASRG